MKRPGTNPPPPAGDKPSPPPNPPRKRSKVQVKFRLSNMTHEKLTLIAKHRGQSLTEIINRAVSAYVAEAKGKATP